VQHPGHLPTPPSDSQKVAYKDQNKDVLVLFGVSSLICLAIGMVRFALHHPYFWVYLPFATMIVFYLAISYIIGISGETFKQDVHSELLDKHKAFRPTVDVYLPNCGEDIDVLENTFRYVSELSWDKEKLNVYVLDDKGRPEVEAASILYGFHYISRPNKGELKKSGNVRNAFPQTKGEFILILDADFCPRYDFLTEALPYFAEHSDVGIIQTPQYFEILPSQPWIQKGAAYIQELFYRLIQVNRNTWDASICVGTCAIYRRAALNVLGGTYPIEHSEDVHTGFSITDQGYKVKYLPVNLAKGLCPDSIRAFFNQQYRWCTGSTTLLFSDMFWKSKLGFMQRICYLSGMLYYSATAIGIFLTPLPGIVMVWFEPENVFWYNTFFSVPSFLFGHIYPAVWSRAPLGWYSFRARLVSYYAHFFAVSDKILNSTAEWVPTGSKSDTSNKKSRFDSFRTVLLWWTTFVTFAVFTGAIHNIHSVENMFDFFPIMFFTGFNYWIAMPILKDQ
jgi:cellulose synthase/poly-beta-1,6-N-acetylglucosamine synthase-like glycosyltransferase